MFPWPERPMMALGYGQASSTAGAAMTASSSSSSTPTISVAFQPSLTSHTSSLPHHDILNYSSSLLVLYHPTTTTSSSHAPSSPIPPHTVHHLHAAHGISPPTSSSPPHPWLTCDEGRDQVEGGQRGKGTAVSEGLAAEHNSAAMAVGVGAVRMKKVGSGGGKARRKVREPRFCFKTMSDVDVLDDGYKWRKYGQKVVKNTKHPSG